VGRKPKLKVQESKNRLGADRRNAPASRTSDRVETGLRMSAIRSRLRCRGSLTYTGAVQG